jgi:uncharacterized protein
MEIMRLVVTGPVGAGKSTFIRSVSEIEVVDTDRRATDETAQLKQKTTVAFDFGRLHFGSDMALHLYGTPGQSRFDFMWDMLIRKAHAYIMLVPANRPAEFRNARRIASFMNQRVSLPMIIGLTHADCADAWAAENIAIALGYLDPQNHPPIIVVNARDTASVAQAVMALVDRFANVCLSNSNLD